MRFEGGSTEARPDLAAVDVLLEAEAVLVRALLPSVDALMVVLAVSGDLEGALKLEGAPAVGSFSDVPRSERREEGRETVAGVLKTAESRRLAVTLLGAGVAPAVPLTAIFRLIYRKHCQISNSGEVRR